MNDASSGGGTTAEQPYEMSISLNVLNHLGLNLYSNHPAVLSEVVANAWDADARRVDVTLGVAGGTIVVADDGIGMTLNDINERFLHVGYQRRNDAATRVSVSGRAVMGRKGIGKLSLFSIARTVLVETARDGQRHALTMDLDRIQATIGTSDPSTTQPYRPAPASTDAIDFAHGTRITLTNLKRSLTRTEGYLARRLARRFTILGAAHDFQVYIGGREVTAADIDQLGVVQYLWTYGDDVDTSSARSLEKVEQRTALAIRDVALSGWIGTAHKSSQLRDSSSSDDLNRITVMVRGKLAQEDLLSEYNEGGLYRAYLIGQLHADFLDVDDEDDIATSSRQRVREDDPRFEQLRDFVHAELKYIQSQWTALRNAAGTKIALDNPAIKAWFDTLRGDTRSKAQSLFGRINRLTVDNDEQRRELFAHGVLAFETMRHKDMLDSLDSLNDASLADLAVLFTESRDLEAVLYHRIVRSRLAVIDRLADLHDEGAKERFVQEHVFKDLWLLDPGWERATDAHMEETMARMFAALRAGAPREEEESRLDIRYQRTSGVHVIVELKRSTVRTTTGVLQDQVRKYRNALREALTNAGKGHESVAVVCLVGRPLRDWDGPNGRIESAQSMESVNARVVMYEELLSNAKHAYQAYLDTAEDVGRVQGVLDALTHEDYDRPAAAPTGGDQPAGDPIVSEPERTIDLAPRRHPDRSRPVRS